MIDDKVARCGIEHVMGVKAPNCGQELVEDMKDRTDVDAENEECATEVCLEKTLMFDQISPTPLAGIHARRGECCECPLWPVHQTGPCANDLQKDGRHVCGCYKTKTYSLTDLLMMRKEGSKRSARAVANGSTQHPSGTLLDDADSLMTT